MIHLPSKETSMRETKASPSRVASRYVQASGWQEVSKQEASLFMPEVWDMYVQTYSAIGLTQSSASEMLADYNHYMLAMDGDKPIAFTFNKRTPHGVKLGLIGSDGSAEGKSYVKSYLSTFHEKPGMYGEVSHAVEKLVMRSNPDVVCVDDAAEVLRKPIDPQEDGMHYKRNLPGVGNVQKIMVGNPLGVESKPLSSGACSSKAVS